MKKKEDKGMHEQEKESGYIILGGLAIIFIYSAFYCNSQKWSRSRMIKMGNLLPKWE